MGFLDRFRSASKATASGHPVGAEASDGKSMRMIDEGNALESQGKIDEAMQRYEAASRLTPNLARAHLNRGNIYLLKGNTDSAVDAYRTAILKDPDYASAHFNLGNAYLQSGDPKQAQIAYKKAIALKPDFTDAYVALACAEEDLGDLDKAVECYERALELQPDYAEVHCNLGSTLKALGRTDAAIASFRTAIAIDPEYSEALVGLSETLRADGKFDELVADIRLVLEKRPDSAVVHNNLGIALNAAGHPNDAIESHRQALALDPGFAAAHHQLGCCLQSLGQHDEAMESYRRALEIDPDLMDSLSNLGNELMVLGRPDEAIVIYQHALTVAPNLAEAHFNLGTAFNRLGDLETAIGCFHEALKIKPDFAGAYNNLGVAQNNLGQFDAALESYRHALELDPTLAHAHSNMGLTLHECRRLEEAIVCFHKALEIDPEFGEAEVNLGMSYSGLGQLDKALPHVRRGMEIMPDNTNAHTALLFLHNYLNDQSATDLLVEAKRFGELVAKIAPEARTAWKNSPTPDRCLRVGFVSGDLRRHPVGFFLEGVLKALASNASERLKIFAYSSTFHSDEITQRLKACCYDWQLITGISDKVVSEKIREDGIDILIDLSGHTMHNRLPLFAWKPAPVQVTWLGYFATTGVAAIDYLLADPWTLPESEEKNFTETVLRLPETRLCFTPPDENVAVSSLPALTRGHITFGCFNTLTKMNDEVVALWSQVLHAVPDSILFLMSHQINEPLVKQQTVARFMAYGVDEKRLVLKGVVPRAEYLAAYNEVDIALDPFPYCGGTTSVEALWMGVPVLTLAGEHFLSRQGVGLLMNAGLPEWVAIDHQDYVARAVSHAGDLKKLASLREGMRVQVMASPIFDAPRFANHFEAALRSMWRDWCKQQATRH